MPYFSVVHPETKREEVVFASTPTRGRVLAMQAWGYDLNEAMLGPALKTWDRDELRRIAKSASHPLQLIAEAAWLTIRCIVTKLDDRAGAEKLSETRGRGERRCRMSRPSSASCPGARPRSRTGAPSRTTT